jgi:hypothetical protein
VGMSFSIQITDNRLQITDADTACSVPTAYYVPVSADRAEAQKTVDLFRVVFEN